jgi:hypothetical protein
MPGACRCRERPVRLPERDPVALHVEQWQRLLEFGDELRQFMKEHDAELKRKGT